MSQSSTVFEDDDAPTPGEQKPGTWKVLSALLTAAGTFSYLGAYAATDVLAKVEVIRPISHNPDRRPMLAAIIFASILTVFLLCGIVMRHLSSREIEQIDEMTDESPA